MYCLFFSLEGSVIFSGKLIFDLLLVEGSVSLSGKQIYCLFFNH